MPWNCLDLTMSQKKANVPTTRSSILPLDCLLPSDVHWLRYSLCVRHLCYHVCVSSNSPAADYLRTAMLLNLQKVRFSSVMCSTYLMLCMVKVTFARVQILHQTKVEIFRVYRKHKHLQHVAIINFSFQKQHPLKVAFHDISCGDRKSLQLCLCWHKDYRFCSAEAIEQILQPMNKVFLPIVCLSWVLKSVLIFQESRLRQLELEWHLLHLALLDPSH